MYSFAVAMEHIIEIEERLTKIVKANASTRQDARSIVEQLYNREEIVLDYSDFSDVAFRVIDSYELVGMASNLVLPPNHHCTINPTIKTSHCYKAIVSKFFHNLILNSI